MSNTKKYTAEEVARMIADRAAEIMKKHEISSEYMEQILEKSKNTAHEIDAGEEPNNDDAECPASLGGEGSSEKSESSEDVSMEDEPLQGDNDSDTEEEETEEDEDEEDEEDEYEFAKSEACGHVIEYKRLVKGTFKDYAPQLNQAKRDARARAKGDSWSTRGSQKGVHASVAGDSGKSLMGYSNRSGNTEAARKEHKANLKELKEMPKPNLVQSEGGLEKAKVDEGLSDKEKVRARSKRNSIMGTSRSSKETEIKRELLDPEGVNTVEGTYHKDDKNRTSRQKKMWSKKNRREQRKIKPNLPKSEDMDKCGEMTYKSESGMFTVEYKRLAKNTGVNVGASFQGSGESMAGEHTRRNKYYKNKSRKNPSNLDLYSHDKNAEDSKKWAKKIKEENIEKIKQIAGSRKLPKSEMTYKAESGMHTVEYKRLAKSGESRMATHQEMQEIRDKKQSNKLWDKWNKKNKKFQEHQEKIKGTKLDTDHPVWTSQANPTGQKNSSVPKMAASEDAKKEENKVEETKGIEFDKKQDADKTEEEKKGVKRPLEKCGEIKKEEMDKCGEMSSGKKLKKFLGKMKKPSPGMIQKPQE